LLPRWHPAQRRREPGSGANVERGKLRPRRCEGTGQCLTWSERENPKRQDPQGAEYRAGAMQRRTDP
jgi:hypothetical protein